MTNHRPMTSLRASGGLSNFFLYTEEAALRIRQIV
jgi:hypothetical protein